MRMQHTECARKSMKAPTTGCGDPLLSVQLVETPKTRLPHPDAQSKYDQFLVVANKLRTEESLRKCPKCCMPARTHELQERAWCTNSNCQFDFCVKCKKSFHGSRDCEHASTKKCRTDVKVGSKKSKKNLKRL